MSEDPQAAAGSSSQETTPPAALPTPESSRIQTLDVIRGFALLGVLLMNMQAFAMIDALYMNPRALGEGSPLDFWLWTTHHVLADQKFMTLFSMLFGAGISLMTESAWQRTGRSATLHYRRMGWLCIFGLIHGLLLWYGDILFLYSLAGSVAYWFRRLRLRFLLPIAIGLVLLPAAFTLTFGVLLQLAPAEELAEMRKMWTPPADLVQQQIDAYRGPWRDQLAFRADQWVNFLGFLWIFVWRVIGVMLLGMILLRTGVLGGGRSRRFYRLLAASGLGIGLPLAAVGVRSNEAAGWQLESGFGTYSLFNYFGSIFAAIGYLALVVLAYQSCWMPGLMRRLAAVGRMAFTNYIVQTLICTSLFYGGTLGAGLFMKTNRAAQLGIVFAIAALQLGYSPAWLARFRFGPLEWLWRTLTYQSVQPLRR